MVSKKTQDVLNTIKNIYELVEESTRSGYEGSMRELIREAMKKTAQEDKKGVSTVASSLTRGLDINGKGSMDNVYEMLESACTNKEGNHSCDDLLVYLLDSINSKDDSEDEVRREYLNIW